MIKLFIMNYKFFFSKEKMYRDRVDFFVSNMLWFFIIFLIPSFYFQKYQIDFEASKNKNFLEFKTKQPLQDLIKEEAILQQKLKEIEVKKTEIQNAK